MKFLFANVVEVKLLGGKDDNGKGLELLSFILAVNKLASQPSIPGETGERLHANFHRIA